MGRCCDCSSRAVLMTVLAACLLFLGWAFNVAAFSSCRFVTVTGGFQSGEDIYFGLGLYTVEGPDGYCYVVDWNNLTANIPYWADRKMNSARACSGIAAFIGLIIMIIAWFLPCFGGGGKCIRITLSMFAMISCILVGLIFLVNMSKTCEGRGCEFSVGGGLAIGAILSYLFGACVLLFAPDYEEEEAFVPPAAQSSAGAQENVTVEKTEHPDGTVTVKTTTTHPDGSKTVEETTESPDIEADPNANLVDAKGY